MSAIRLLVLGAVRRHGRAHGYQVRNDLEFWGAHEWGNIKPGSIYHALKQMARQGLLHAFDTAPSPAGGPPRTEYELTGAGTAEYFALLRGALTTPDKPDLLSAGLGFLPDLTRAEAIGLLEQRVKNLRAWRDAVTRDYLADYTMEELGHIGEIMRRWLHTAEADAEWTRGLIERIAGGAHIFAGEDGDPFAGVIAEEHDLPPGR
jgi:DNA-binding PadR family transcriptional regulator